jgi:HAE1 family hydrophobic/amphiphilic exporter-1
VLLSSLVALTLCPMLASRMLTEMSTSHHGALGKLGTRLPPTSAACMPASMRRWIVIMVVGAVCRCRLHAFGSVARS